MHFAEAKCLRNLAFGQTGGPAYLSVRPFDHRVSYTPNNREETGCQWQSESRNVAASRTLHRQALRQTLSLDLVQWLKRAICGQRLAWLREDPCRHFEDRSSALFHTSILS